MRRCAGCPFLDIAQDALEPSRKNARCMAKDRRIAFAYDRFAVREPGGYASEYGADPDPLDAQDAGDILAERLARKRPPAWCPLPGSERSA